MSQPNILLVVLDSVRAKNISLHNYPVQTTPYLEQFAEKYTYYTQARSPGIHSIASHASIFTGLEVEEHRLFEHESRLASDASIWTELEQEYDYQTGLFTPNVVLTESSNLSDHFSHVKGPKRFTRPEDGLRLTDFEGDLTKSAFIRAALTHPKPLKSIMNGFRYFTKDYEASHDPENERADVYVSEFCNWANEATRPWAACINLMDAHYPYDAQPEFRSYNDPKLRDLLKEFDGAMSYEILPDERWWILDALEYLYNECIRQVDAAVESLIHKLKNIGQFENTLIIITSDHGEAFGEFSQVSPSVRLCDHGWGIHEVQTHIPLLVKRPNHTEQSVIRKLATLSEFPNVVRSVLSNNSTQSFVTDSGKVISSTYRVPEPGDTLPDVPNKGDYIGPWRAVYQESPQGLIKKSTHGKDGATIHIQSAQEEYVASRDYPKDVDEEFSSLTDANVKLGLEDTDDRVEDRLESLGYLR